MSEIQEQRARSRAKLSSFHTDLGTARRELKTVSSVSAQCLSYDGSVKGDIDIPLQHFRLLQRAITRLGKGLRGFKTQHAEGLEAKDGGSSLAEAPRREGGEAEGGEG